MHEPHEAEIKAALEGAGEIVASCLTLVECDRVLIRAERTEPEESERVPGLHSKLRRTASQWLVLKMTDEIVERARRPFPAEPVRTLDALHLASADHARSIVTDLAVLSLDDRVRRSAARMGFEVVPEQVGASAADCS